MYALGERIVTGVLDGQRRKPKTKNGKRGTWVEKSSLSPERPWGGCSNSIRAQVFPMTIMTRPHLLGSATQHTERKTCSQPSSHKRLGRHAMHEASAFWAYLLPPYPGSSMCPQASKAVELCIHMIISSICAADKPGWALIALNWNLTTLHDLLSIPLTYNIIICALIFSFFTPSAHLSLI